MLGYIYYKSNNKDIYREHNYEKDIELKATESLLLKCISCKGSYTDAYKCKNTYCPLYIVKTDKMKRPHTASEAFINARISMDELNKLNPKKNKQNEKKDN